MSSFRFWISFKFEHLFLQFPRVSHYFQLQQTTRVIWVRSIDNRFKKNWGKMTSSNSEISNTVFILVWVKQGVVVYMEVNVHLIYHKMWRWSRYKNMVFFIYLTSSKSNKMLMIFWSTLCFYICKTCHLLWGVKFTIWCDFS